MVGNDLSAHFRSTGFLVNDAALGYMRRMNLPARTVSLPAGHPRKRFSDAEARGAHPAAHGIAGIASEGERVAGTVVPGDDAGQFNVDDHHALCRVHAEHLVRKLPCSTDYRLSRVEPVVAGIWDFYAELSE